MKSIRLEPSKLLGFHAMHPSAQPGSPRQPLRFVETSKAAAKNGAKVGVKIGLKAGIKVGIKA